MGEELGISESKSTMITICIIYRCISLGISTAVYLIYSPEGSLFLHISVALGTISAGGLGAFLYRRYMTEPENRWLVALLYAEIIVYGLIIILSGGVFSPYLWYFISILVLTMGVSIGPKNGRYRTGVQFSLLWGFLCALAGCRYLPQNDVDYARMNIIIGFLLVAGSFYAIFTYSLKLDKSRQELIRLNISLEQESAQSKQALRYAIDIYDTFYIFGITEADKVMEEMAKILYETIAPKGCVLVKMDLMRQVQTMASAGLTDEQEAVLFDYLRGINTFEMNGPDQEADSEKQGIDNIIKQQVHLEGVGYERSFIYNMLNPVGILFKPIDEKEDGRAGEQGKAIREQLYLRIAGIILQNIDLQAMVELAVASEEQNRMANEIHDTVLQKLFGIACNLRVLEIRQENVDIQENQKQIQGILVAIESTMKELRETIYGERWNDTEKESFMNRLTDYMEEIQYLHEVKILLHMDIDTRQMSVNLKTVLYRVACEAVNNAVRHGKADQIEVNISMTEAECIVVIKDNGRGFDRKEMIKHGRGLQNISHMILCLKGQVSIDSQPGSGTIISCRVPK